MFMNEIGREKKNKLLEDLNQLYAIKVTRRSNKTLFLNC
ncbi:unnamed protein product [Brassica oleracea]